MGIGSSKTAPTQIIPLEDHVENFAQWLRAHMDTTCDDVTLNNAEHPALQAAAREYDLAQKLSVDPFLYHEILIIFSKQLSLDHREDYEHTFNDARYELALKKFKLAALYPHDQQRRLESQDAFIDAFLQIQNNQEAAESAWQILDEALDQLEENEKYIHQDQRTLANMNLINALCRDPLSFAPIHDPILVLPTNPLFKDRERIYQYHSHYQFKRLPTFKKKLQTFYETLLEDKNAQHHQSIAAFCHDLRHKKHVPENALAIPEDPVDIILPSHSELVLKELDQFFQQKPNKNTLFLIYSMIYILWLLVILTERDWHHFIRTGEDENGEIEKYKIIPETWIYFCAFPVALTLFTAMFLKAIKLVPSMMLRQQKIAKNPQESMPADIIPPEPLPNHLTIDQKPIARIETFALWLRAYLDRGDHNLIMNSDHYPIMKKFAQEYDKAKALSVDQTLYYQALSFFSKALPKSDMNLYKKALEKFKIAAINPHIQTFRTEAENAFRIAFTHAHYHVNFAWTNINKVLDNLAQNNDYIHQERRIAANKTFIAALCIDDIALDPITRPMFLFDTDDHPDFSKKIYQYQPSLVYDEDNRRHWKEREHYCFLPALEKEFKHFYTLFHQDVSKSKNIPPILKIFFDKEIQPLMKEGFSKSSETISNKYKYIFLAALSMGIIGAVIGFSTFQDTGFSATEYNAYGKRNMSLNTNDKIYVSCLSVIFAVVGALCAWAVYAWDAKQEKRATSIPLLPLARRANHPTENAQGERQPLLRVN